MVVECTGGTSHQREKKIVQELVKEERRCVETKILVTKQEVKQIIATVGEREMEHTLERLTKQKTEGLKQIFRMARQAKKNKTDITGIPCIRGIDGQLKVSWNRIG